MSGSCVPLFGMPKKKFFLEDTKKHEKNHIRKQTKTANKKLLYIIKLSNETWIFNRNEK